MDFFHCLNHIFKMIVQGASGEGAFDGMKVSYLSRQNPIEMVIDHGFDIDVSIQMILVVPDQKQGQFERLIEAGGGQVVKGRWVESLLKVKPTYIPFESGRIIAERKAYVHSYCSVEHD